MRGDSSLFAGIMSGTSADGIDIAIVRFDEADNARPELVHFSEQAMPAALREAVLRLGAGDYGESDAIELMGSTDRALGRQYAEAVLAALAESRLSPTSIAAIGCHGQTIRHRPANTPAFTLQIGCAATITEITGITTISDFRSRDIAAGGEGAPLVPFAHRLLFGTEESSAAVLNIGGIANITWLGADGSASGFDTGPGNMIMDGLIAALSNGAQAFDADGALAASGHPCSPLLDQLLAHPYLERRPPKSTGREAFGATIIAQILDWPGLSDADRLATACHYTADTVARAAAFLPEPPARWLCCGGGVRNHHLMRLLGERLAPAPVASTDTAGVPPQAVESLSFALLARHTLAGRPNTLASVTGATHDVCGGRITPGDNWPRLIEQIGQWTR